MKKLIDLVFLDTVYPLWDIADYTDVNGERVSYEELDLKVVGVCYEEGALILPGDETILQVYCTKNEVLWSMPAPAGSVLKEMNVSVGDKVSSSEVLARVKIAPTIVVLVVLIKVRCALLVRDVLEVLWDGLSDQNERFSMLFRRFTNFATTIILILMASIFTIGPMYFYADKLLPLVVKYEKTLGLNEGKDNDDVLRNEKKY